MTTNDNVDVIVPNSEFINGRVTNWTFDDALRRIHIPFDVAYGTDTRAPEVWFTGFGDSSLDFELAVWVSQALAMAPARIQARYLWEIKTALGEAGIETPFPQRGLHLHSGELCIDLAPATGVAGSKLCRTATKW